MENRLAGCCSVDRNSGRMAGNSLDLLIYITVLSNSKCSKKICLVRGHKSEPLAGLVVLTDVKCVSNVQIIHDV